MEDFIKEYNKIGDSKINDLYTFSCLKNSGFSEEIAYNNISLLNDLWLKDENNLCLSTLSDMLYDAYDNLDLENMTTREILLAIYEY